jgi:hypothetical protein
MDTSKAGQYLTPPTSHPLYVRIRAVVADWEVPEERLSDFLVLDKLSIPEVKLVDEDQAEKNRTRAAIRGTSEGSSPGRQAMKPVVPDGGLHRNLVGGTLEFLMREIIEEKSFVELVEGMLAQDAPFYVQYEDTPPPGVPDHKQSSNPAAAASAAPVTPSGEGGFDELKALLGNRPEPAWCSELLGDFPEPELEVTAASNAVVGAAPPGPSNLSLARSLSEPMVPPSPGAASEAPATPSQAILDDAMSKHGEVSLEAFKNSAGEVLDQVLLDVMDDVIAGRLNWQRPLPRVRGRRDVR